MSELEGFTPEAERLWHKASPSPLGPEALARIARRLRLQERRPSPAWLRFGWKPVALAVGLLTLASTAGATMAVLLVGRHVLVPPAAPYRRLPATRSLGEARAAAFAAPAPAPEAAAFPAAAKARVHPTSPAEHWPAAEVPRVRPGSARGAPRALARSRSRTAAAVVPSPNPAAVEERPAAVESEMRAIVQAASGLRQDQDPKALADLGRQADLLAVLEGLNLGSLSLSRQLLVMRGELRLGDGRMADALRDFDAVLLGDERDDLAARALYGRSVARRLAGHTAVADEDLRLYLRLFPAGPRAEEARRTLGPDRKSP